MNDYYEMKNGVKSEEEWLSAFPLMSILCVGLMKDQYHGTFVLNIVPVAPGGISSRIRVDLARCLTQRTRVELTVYLGKDIGCLLSGTYRNVQFCMCLTLACAVTFVWEFVMGVIGLAMSQDVCDIRVGVCNGRDWFSRVIEQ